LVLEDAFSYALEVGEIALLTTMNSGHRLRRRNRGKVSESASALGFAPLGLYTYNRLDRLLAVCY
jgi:hypothetical protein